jgi:hypothetical protein
MRLLLATLVMASSLGCVSDGPTPPKTIRRAATIEFYGDSSHFTVPSFAQVNSPFVVTFRAYGGGCISDAINEVSTIGSTTEIHSFHEMPSGEAICTAELRIETVSVTVTFTSLGVGHVILRGQRQPGDVPITIDRTVNLGIP